LIVSSRLLKLIKNNVVDCLCSYLQSPYSLNYIAIKHKYLFLSISRTTLRSSYFLVNQGHKELSICVKLNEVVSKRYVLRSIKAKNFSNEPLALSAHRNVIILKNQSSFQICTRVVAVDFKSESTWHRIKEHLVTSKNCIDWFNRPKDVNFNVKNTVFNNQPFFFHFMNRE